MVYSVSIQSGARAPADPGPRGDPPTLVFEGFPLVGEASPEDVSRALKVARRVVPYPDTDTDSATDSATEPEAAPPRVEDALKGFVKVEALVPQAEWRIEDPTPVGTTTNENPNEKKKVSTDDARAPPPSLAADPLPPIDLVLKAEVLKAEAETIGGREGKEAQTTNPRNRLARRTKTHGARGVFSSDRGATRDLERSVVRSPPATRGSRRRASVSVNDLASDPAKAREIKPKLPKPADEKKKKKRRASLPASTPATPARGGAKKNAGKKARRKSEPFCKSAAPEPEKAPASYAVSEPDPEVPPARSGGPPGGPLAPAPGVSGSVPPPPPPPPAAPAPAARARDALRHAKALLDEACISPAEYEAVKRECLRRILWG